MQALQEALSNGVNTELDLQRLQAQVGMWGGDVQRGCGEKQGQSWKVLSRAGAVNAALDLQRLQAQVGMWGGTWRGDIKKSRGRG